MDLNSIKDTMNATGMVHVVKKNKYGKIIQEFSVPNLVVTTGKNYIAQKMIATTNSPASMTHMAIGTGTTTPAAGDLALGNESGRAVLTGNTVNANSITYTCTFAAGVGGGAITEAGIFNASSSGTMLCRTVFPVVTKGSGDSIAVTWVITVS